MSAPRMGINTETEPSSQHSSQIIETLELPAANSQEPELRSNSELGRATYLRILSASFAFFAAGVHDGSIGALIPYIIQDYNINTAIVSSIYGATFFGWLFAALTNTHLCQVLDRGAILALSAICQLTAHALRSWKPPFGLFIFSFWLVSVGQAYNEIQANTFIIKIERSYHWLAITHACFTLGSLVGPFVATAIASVNTSSKWYLFYAFLSGISVLNLGLITWAFYGALFMKPKAQSQYEPHRSTNRRTISLIISTLQHPTVWFLSTFYFFYLGSQITLSGWIVEYLVSVRGGDLSQLGFIPAGFNGGGFLGRLLLAVPTYKLGERLMVFIYCVIAIAFHLVFWLVPNIIAASVSVILTGFFIGPFFATGMSLGAKLFPPEIQTTALAFVFAFAQLGGSLFPIVTGVIASDIGISVLPAVLVGTLVAMTISWLLVPRLSRPD